MKRFLCVLLALALSLSLFGAAFSVSAADIDFDGLRDIWDADSSSNYAKTYNQATSLSLSISDTDGWNGSKALCFSATDSTNEWANYAQIVPDVSDWYGAEYLYFYVKNYTGNLNLSLVCSGTEYKLKNGVSDAAGRWNGSAWDTVKTGDSWFFLQVGTNYTGWLRIKLTSFAVPDSSGNSTDDMPTSALTSVGKVMFSVSGLKSEQYPMSVYFDKFMISGGSFVPDDAPAGLRGVWDFDDLTENTEYMGSYYQSQASLTPVSYNDGLGMQWQCKNMDWVAPQGITLKTADFSGASELWFWADLTDWSASTCRIGVGIGDADGVSYLPGEGDTYSYSSVRIWYYSASGVKVTSNLSSWGWIKTLPANYSGWVGISLTDFAELMADKEFDCTRVTTLYLGLDDAKGNTTDRYIVDNFCINSDPNGLHVSDADKAATLKVTVTMPENPTTERNFTWHTNGWAQSDLQVVPAEGKTAETVVFGGADTLSFEGEIIATQYSAYVHNAKADGLTPGTEYFFRVGDASLDVWSDTGSFVTDDGDETFSFIYLADMQTGTTDAKKTLYTLQKAMETAPDAEFFMNTGDLVNNPGNNSEYLAVLDKDGAFAFANQTTAIVAGNHDYYSNEVYVDYILRNHFYFDQAETSTSPSGVYYSFNYGNVHFVALNANSSMYADLDAEQVAWLKADLSSDAAKNADFRVVMMHRGVFTTGPHYYYYQDISCLTSQMPSIMAEYDVDLVFQGHDHVYALTKQIGADGTATDSVTSYVWSDGANAYVEAMNQNESPVYFIGGTAGTKYEPAPVQDEETGLWTIPATSSNAVGKYTMNVSQAAMTEYLSKFQFSETPANESGRSQAMFSVVTVRGGQLVVDSYTVDNQVLGECKYYSSFALDKEEPTACAHEHTELRNASAADCTTAGYTGDTYCTDCGELISEGTAIAALGHNFVDGKCTRCDAEDPDYEAKDPCEGYTDIDRKAWYHTAADFVIANGLMGSTKADTLTFEPNTKVSRAMVASILYRMAGSPEVEYNGTFIDVPAGKWYSNAIEWCAQNGLASGKGNGKFDPNGNVTRQELAVFMKKMAEYLKEDTTATAELSTFADGEKVPAWAKDYISWAVAAGLISGKVSNGQTYLAPTDNATRAELASILMRF